jgi:hypothetical protein
MFVAFRIKVCMLYRDFVGLDVPGQLTFTTIVVLKAGALMVWIPPPKGITMCQIALW